MPVLLDGPMGTQLAALGVPTRLPQWSAPANAEAAETVRAVHRAYAEAGATVHTANTFRTTERVVGDGWRRLAQLAVEHARQAVPPEHRVAGSIAPLEDCYRPDLSPEDPRPEHAQLARHLAALDVDVLLVETFPHVGEALIAAEEAVATGVETWLALTAGPGADLLTPTALAAAATTAIQRGVAKVLVNCVPATRVEPFLQPLAQRHLPFGVYANAGHPDEAIGWIDAPFGAKRYAELALGWADMGADIIGGCCGTGPEHVEALAHALRRRCHEAG